jgi:hypothetical protein
VDVVGERERSSQRRGIARWLPVHIGDLVARAKLLLRPAVAVETPLHGQRRELLDARHLVDTAVAGGAADSLVHVDGVIEIDEVGEVIDAHPGDGAIAEVGSAHRVEQRSAVPDLGMAIEAFAGSGEARAGGALDGVVAIAAVDARVLHVVAMVELERLLDGLTLIGEKGGTDPQQEQREAGDDATGESEQSGPGDAVGPAWEEGAH